jgi:hypothetical protein
VTVPAGVDGATVPVTVVNPDGQAATAASGFFYVPPPVITRIRTLLGGVVVGGPLAGGETVVVQGTSFNPQDTVRFGGNQALSQYGSADRINVTVPQASAPGQVKVFVMDEFGREAESPFIYEYTAGTTIQGPLSPAVVAPAGGTVVTISGSGFETTDVVLLNGNHVASNFIDSTTIEFTVPALAAGTHTVQIQDRFGSVTNGPDLTVKGAPTVVDLQDNSGAPVRSGPVAGGAVVRVIGTNLSAQDVVKFGGTVAQHDSFVSSTQLRVIVPAAAAASVVPISVTDSAGQTAQSSFVYTYGTLSGNMASQVGQYGITWTFDKPYEVGQFVNGDWWVVGPVTVNSVSPATSGGRHGSVVNPVDGQPSGYDSRTPSYDSRLTVSYPVTLTAGSSLVSTISHTTPGRHTDMTGTGVSENNGYLQTAAVLTVLSGPVQDTCFRPPLVGTEKPVYDSATIDFSRLPRLAATSGNMSLAPVAGKTKVQQYIRYFQRPWILHGYDYIGRTMHPSDNQANYHREVYNMIADASVLMLTDDPDVEELLLNMVQVGIDSHYATKLGPILDSTLHKWPVVLAGLVLDVDEMKTPTYKFRTDWMSYYAQNGTSAVVSTKVAAGKGWTGATVLWCQDPGPAEHEHLDPTEWHLVTQGGDGMKREQYRRLNSHSWPGAALAALALGAKANWGHDAFFDYVDRWMTEPDSANFAYIESLYAPRKLVIPGGYVASTFVKNMWNTYRSNY